VTIPQAPASLPALTTQQMREVDRIMVEDLHIDLLQMMENAGRALALLAADRFRIRRVVVLAGPGGNGGGGMVAARHLANRGADVTVVLSRPRSNLDAVPQHQAAILSRMDVTISDDPPPAPDVIVDAVIGYSLSGDPRGRSAELIEWANASRAPTLSLDTPSGLNLTSGRVGEPTVRADATMTLALPKQGLFDAPEVVGDLFLADIGVPPSVYAAFGIDLTDPFQAGPVVRIGE